MALNEQKQLARKLRERRLRGWLTTLSWSTPVIAFGGFFTIWHHVSAAVITPTSFESKTTVTNPLKSAQTPLLFQIGSQGSQVSIVQEHLAQLGYFHHAITRDYGPVTADAVKSFQINYGLPATGAIDGKTLTSIQQAVKQNSVKDLTESVDNNSQNGISSSTQDMNSQSGIGSGQNSAPAAPVQSSLSGSTGLNQQGSPVAVSSAS